MRASTIKSNICTYFNQSCIGCINRIIHIKYIDHEDAYFHKFKIRGKMYYVFAIRFVP